MKVEYSYIEIEGFNGVKRKVNVPKGTLIISFDPFIGIWCMMFVVGLTL